MMKKVVIPVIAVIVLSGGYFAVTSAHAQTSTPFSGLAQAIANQFHLNQNDVQNTITTWQQQNKANRIQTLQDRLTTRLDQAVANGKITAAQKQAILDKLNQMKSALSQQNFKSMTAAQRQAFFKQQKSDLEAWAKAQGINQSVLPGLIPGRMMGMMHKIK